MPSDNAITLACPDCKQVFLPDDVNVGTDVAFCRRCNKAQVLSTLVSAGAGGIASRGKAFKWGVSLATMAAKRAGEGNLQSEAERERMEAMLAAVDISRPPAGAWYRDDGIELCVGATMRSVGGALALLAFSLFWNGIVSVFVSLAIAGTIQQLGFTVPAWFPSPTMKGSGIHNGIMSLGMVVFMWIFLTPFIVIGCAMIGGFLSCLFGRVEVTVRDAAGTVFTGIGAIGFRQRFDASAVTGVRIVEKVSVDSESGRTKSTRIVIDADRPVKFGSTMKDERRWFIAGALRKALVG